MQLEVSPRQADYIIEALDILYDEYCVDADDRAEDIDDLREEVEKQKRHYETKWDL